MSNTVSSRISLPMADDPYGDFLLYLINHISLNIDLFTVQAAVKMMLATEAGGVAEAIAVAEFVGYLQTHLGEPVDESLFHAFAHFVYTIESMGKNDFPF